MRIKTFSGLNNVNDPFELGVGEFVTADNVNFDSAGHIKSREGYVKVVNDAFTDPVTSAFAIPSGGRGFVVCGQKILKITGEHVADLTTDDVMYWTEVNNEIFFNNGEDSGIITVDDSVIPWRWPTPPKPSISFSGKANADSYIAKGSYTAYCTITLPDGRETGVGAPQTSITQGGSALSASGSLPGYTVNTYVTIGDGGVYYKVDRGVFHPGDLGEQLPTGLFSALPDGVTVIQHWGGRIYAAQYTPSLDTTVVWFSQPLAYHLFDLEKDFFMVQGEVRMLAPTKKALIIGTTVNILAYDEESLTTLAEYGVPPGRHWDTADDLTYFWSLRGVCRALPFENLTERQVSVAPGVYAGGAIIERDGQQRYLAAVTQGGVAFNPSL